METIFSTASMGTLIPASLVGTLIVFLAKIWYERSAIRSAFISDMNLVLQRARETLEYLQSDDHYWLRVNSTLARAPSDVINKSSIFTGLLPKLYLLGPRAVTRILAFYAHFQYCDGLKTSLFNHIDSHVKSQTPLTDSDVKLLRLRRDRICAGFSSLVNTFNGERITVLRKLPTQYEIPSTSEVAKKINQSPPSPRKHMSLPKRRKQS